MSPARLGLALLVLVGGAGALAPGVARADHDVHVTSYVAFGFGPAPSLAGSLGHELRSTGTGAMVALGGSAGPIGVELEVRGGGMEQPGATDWRDRDRSLVAYGLALRWALVAGRFGGLYARGGLVAGSIRGQESQITPAGCVPELPGQCEPVSYTPPSISLWGAHGGLRAQAQLPLPDHGFIALFAQADASLLRLGLDGGRVGLATSASAGLSFGCIY